MLMFATGNGPVSVGKTLRKDLNCWGSDGLPSERRQNAVRTPTSGRHREADEEEGK